MIGARRSTRLSNKDPEPGSAFHELVVLPTFAPALARPYRVPGTDRVYNLEFGDPSIALDQDAVISQGGEENTTESSQGILDPEPTVAFQIVERTFSLHVTILYPPKSASAAKGGTKAKGVAKPLTKVHPDLKPLLDFSRGDIVDAILATHSLQERFQAHPTSGPDFQISWKGSVGGKSGVRTIQVDDDWRKLCEDLGRQPRVTDIIVYLDGHLLSPRFERIQLGVLPHEVDPEEEIFPGTKVPEVTDFPQETQVLAGLMDELKGEWKCATHGPCYIAPSGKHIPLTKFRLTGWASEIKAGRSTVKDPPSDSLLVHWQVVASPPPKPRGRVNPATVVPETPHPTALDPVSAMVTMVTPLIAVALARYLDVPAPGPIASAASPPSPSQHPGSKRHRTNSISPSRRESSPPPNVEDELESCLVAFGHSKALADVVINTAITQFSSHGYTPDILADSDISNERIQEVSGLPEGTVAGLRKFARNWCGQLEVKRARISA